MPDAFTVRLVRTALVVGLIAVPMSRTAPAGAAISNFSLSPASGPPGTVVAVSGSGCAPGFLLSSKLDHVRIAVTSVPPVSVRLAVAANGSWHGTFSVPANAVATPAIVSVLCISDGLQSLLTPYTPKTFTITGRAPITVPTLPPTTLPSGPSVGPVTLPTTTSSRPPRSTTHTTPTAAPATRGTSPTGPPVTSTRPAASPGAIGGGTSAGGSDPSDGPRATTTGTTGSHAQTAHTAHGVYAADLSAPDAVNADAPGGSGGLGWLLWLLLAAGLLLLLAPLGWRWLHASNDAVEPDET